MHELRFFLLLTGLAFGLCAGAQPPNQDCSGAINLCAQQPLTGQNNTNATGSVPSPCPPGDNLLWYTFTTNSQGGAVNVALTDIACPNILNMYNQLSATVFSGDGSCTPASFVSVSPCGHDSLPFHVTTRPAATSSYCAPGSPDTGLSMSQNPSAHEDTHSKTLSGWYCAL